MYLQSKESVVPESTKVMRSNPRKSIGKRLADEEDTKDVRSYKYRRGKRREAPYTVGICTMFLMYSPQ